MQIKDNQNGGLNTMPRFEGKKIDYKDVETLKKCLNPHGRILPRKRTGLSAKVQHKVALAIKRARYMALLPYVAK